MSLKQQPPTSGRTIQFIKDRENICLTSDQARDIYKKVEKESTVNVETIKEEIEKGRLGNDNEEENQYHTLIINDFDRINVNVNISQMEKWLILSNVVNYVQYTRNPRDYYKLEVKALEPKSIGKSMTG